MYLALVCPNGGPTLLNLRSTIPTGFLTHTLMCGWHQKGLSGSLLEACDLGEDGGRFFF
jgi:hypothetical protein